MSREDRLASVTQDCASVGLDLRPVIQRLYLSRLLQFATCLTAGILGLSLVEGEQSLPSIALDFLAAGLTVLKVLVLFYRPDGVFRKKLSFILDIVNAFVLLGAGSAQSTYVKDLPEYSAALTASYMLSFIGAALFFLSALRIRSVNKRLQQVDKQRLLPVAQPTVVVVARGDPLPYSG